MEESKKTEQQEVQQQQTQELNAEGNASTLWVDPYPPERETRIFPGDSPYPWWCFIKYIVGPGVNDDFTVVGQKNDLAEWPRAPNRESPEAWQLRYQYFDFVIAKYCWRIEACQYPAWCLFFDDNYHSVGLEYPVRAHWYGDRNDWFMYDWDAAPHLLKEKHPELYDKYVEDTEKYNATLPPEKRMAPFTKHESELRYNLPTPIQIDGTSLVKIYPNILYEPYRYVLHIDEDGGNQYAPGQFDVRIQPDTYSVNTNMYFNGTCVIIPFQPVQFASISLVNHPTQFLSVATCGTNSYNADFNVRTQAKETKLGLVIMNEGDSRYRITIDDHYIFPATGGSRAINGDFDIRSHPHKEEDRNVWLVKFDYNEKAFTITSETHPNLYLSIDPTNKNADGEIDVRTSTKPCYWNVEGHEKRNIMHNRKLQREKFEKELLEKKAQQLQKETEKLEKDTEKLVAS